MNVYAGHNRRQIGGSIWSTIWRGLKPILKHLGEKLKPIGKSVAKRAAKSALDVGSSIATDALMGKIDKTSVKNKIVNEAKQLKDEGFRNLKRKLGMQEGDGVPRKRRRISKVNKSKVKTHTTTKKRKSTRKSPKTRAAKKKLVKKPKKRTKCVKKCINKKQTKRKKNTSRKSAVSHKAIKDIFG